MLNISEAEVQPIAKQSKPFATNWANTVSKAVEKKKPIEKPKTPAVEKVDPFSSFYGSQD